MTYTVSSGTLNSSIPYIEYGHQGCCCCCYRQDAAKRQIDHIKFTHRPKISIFASQGRLVTPIHMKFGTAKGHVGPLGRAEFHANQCLGVGTWPKMVEISTFW